MPDARQDQTSTALIVVRHGSYRFGAYVLFGAGLLVFGGLWLLVLVDWLQTGLDVARVYVLGAIALVAPLGLLAWGLRRAGRARRGADFDQLELKPGGLAAVHRFTGERHALTWDQVEALALVCYPPPPGAQMEDWILQIRRTDGGLLASERLRFVDRLRADLGRHGLEWREEDASHITG